MSIFAISDLHLSFSADKSMEVFRGWEHYTERIEKNWKRVVTENDTVVLPGDISWALKTEDALEDFKFLNRLPGKKILLKGNHDLWWTTRAKITNFFAENNLNTLTPLFNDAITVEGAVICGTRGWLYEESCEAKIRKREVGRLKLSLTAAEQLAGEKLLFMHYPPAYGDFVCEDFLNLIAEHGIQTVYYGHIHGSGYAQTVPKAGGINLKLISADTLNFTPMLIRKG